MEFIEIDHPRCKARIALRGAQLLSFVPKGGSDIFWCTSPEFITEGRPIRGGVPICWPWFGAHSYDSSLPSHGFARSLDWALISSEKLIEFHRLVFELNSSDKTRVMWPYEFSVRVVMELGNQCRLSLIVKTEGEWTGALHSYLRVSDIEKVTISGLGNIYQDNLDNKRVKNCSNTITIKGPTEQLFLQPESNVILERSNFDKIIIGQSGHTDAMVWTPWKNAGTSPNDMHCDDYKSMICVETSRIQQNQKSGQLTAVFSVSS